MSEPCPRRFKVSMSAAQSDLLVTEGKRARASDLLPDFLAALKEIDFRLTVEPDDWGESREYLPELRVRMRCGTSRMVTVLYGVAEDTDVVFVKEFRINRTYTPPAKA